MRVANQFSTCSHSPARVRSRIIYSRNLIEVMRLSAHTHISRDVLRNSRCRCDCNEAVWSRFDSTREVHMKTNNRSAIRLALATVSTLLVLCPFVARADVVQDWNIIMQTTVGGQPPFPQFRFAAITQLAVFEAVNSITHDYRPYLGTITAPAGASAEAAAVAAAQRCSKPIFLQVRLAWMPRGRFRWRQFQTARPRALGSR